MSSEQTTFVPEQVHLVGSIGLNSVEEIFRTVGQRLGRRLKRSPDGEIGGRRLWISWQYPLLRASPFLVPDPSGAVHRISRFPILSLADGVKPEQLDFGELGYAREARASYEDFCSARKRGDLPGRIRFQVCLPTPMAVIYAYCIERDVLAVYEAYEKDMIREVAAICAAIPHHDLCIQRDVCHEMLIWDGQPLDMFPKVGTSHDEILRRMQRICASVPEDVELGVHLCYGDFRAKHSWSRAMRETWLSWPTRSQAPSSIRSPLFTCRYRSPERTMRSLRRFRASSSPRQPNFIWAWCMRPTEWTAPNGAWQPPADTREPSGSQRNAGLLVPARPIWSSRSSIYTPRYRKSRRRRERWFDRCFGALAH